MLIIKQAPPSNQLKVFTFQLSSAPFLKKEENWDFNAVIPIGIQEMNLVAYKIVLKTEIIFFFKQNFW